MSWRSDLPVFCWRGRITDSQNTFERAAALAENANVEAADLSLAAAIARCRVDGPDALRLEELAARQALAGGDIDLAVRCFAGSAELIDRFAGMFDDPPPEERGRELLENARAHSTHSPVAAFTLAATEAGLDPKRNLDELEDFVHRALDAGEHVQASGLLRRDRSPAHRGPPSGRRPRSMSPSARHRRRDGIRSTARSGAEDALHTAIFTATGAGQLREAAQLAARHALLPFLRDEPDLALEEGIAPDAARGKLGRCDRGGPGLLGRLGAGWSTNGTWTWHCAYSARHGSWTSRRGRRTLPHGSKPST